MRRLMMLLAISMLLSATTTQAAVIGVREFSRDGGSFFDSTDMFPDAGTGAAIYVCVGGVDDCDILDIGASIFGTQFTQSMLQITADATFVQLPINPAAEALLTNGSLDTFSVLFSQCSNAPSPGAGLCVGGGSGSGFGQSEYNFFGNDGDDPGLAPSGVDFAGFDLTHVELEISNFNYLRTNLGSGQLVSWRYDAAIRVHGDPAGPPVPEPHAALVFAIGLVVATRGARRR